LDFKEFFLFDDQLFNDAVCEICFLNEFKSKYPNETFVVCNDCKVVIYKPKVGHNYFTDNTNQYCFTCQFDES
jgi:hypothetical protein